jgi:hypothetical protein
MELRFVAEVKSPIELITAELPGKPVPDCIAGIKRIRFFCSAKH